MPKAFPGTYFLSLQKVISSHPSSDGVVNDHRPSPAKCTEVSLTQLFNCNRKYSLTFHCIRGVAFLISSCLVTLKPHLKYFKNFFIGTLK